MYKVDKHISPDFMKSVFPKICNHYNLRKEKTFYPKDIKTGYYGSETISFWGPSIWSALPNEMKNAKGLSEFKNRIKCWEPKGCCCRICKIYIEKLGFL